MRLGLSALVLFRSFFSYLSLNSFHKVFLLLVVPSLPSLIPPIALYTFTISHCLKQRRFKVITPSQVFVSPRSMRRNNHFFAFVSKGQILSSALRPPLLSSSSLSPSHLKISSRSSSFCRRASNPSFDWKEEEATGVLEADAEGFVSGRPR